MHKRERGQKNNSEGALIRGIDGYESCGWLRDKFQSSWLTRQVLVSWERDKLYLKHPLDNIRLATANNSYLPWEIKTSSKAASSAGSCAATAASQNSKHNNSGPSPTSTSPFSSTSTPTTASATVSKASIAANPWSSSKKISTSKKEWSRLPCSANSKKAQTDPPIRTSSSPTLSPASRDQAASRRQTTSTSCTTTSRLICWKSSSPGWLQGKISARMTSRPSWNVRLAWLSLREGIHSARTAAL